MIEHDLIDGYIDESSNLDPDIFQKLRDQLQ
jgi:hypothetical protein